MRVLSLVLLVWAVAAAACSSGSNAGGDRSGAGDGGSGGWAPGGSGGGGAGGTGGDGGLGGTDGPGGAGGIEFVPGRIHGTASLDPGGPAAGIRVVLSGPSSAETLTASDGGYAFDELPAGTYALAFSFGSYWPEEGGGLVVVSGANLEVSPTLALRKRIDDGDWGGRQYVTAPADGVAYLAGCTEAACDLRFWHDGPARSRYLGSWADVQRGNRDVPEPSFRVSPDGRWLAFSPAAPGLLDIPGGDLVPLDADAAELTFDRGSRWLAWLDHASREVRALDLAGGEQQTACNVGDGDDRDLWRLATAGDPALLCRDAGPDGLVRLELAHGTREVFGGSDAELAWASADLRDVLVLDRLDAVTSRGSLSLWGADGTRLPVAGDVGREGVVRDLDGARILVESGTQDHGDPIRLTRLDVPGRRVDLVADGVVDWLSGWERSQIYVADVWLDRPPFLAEPAGGTLRSWDDVSGTATPVAGAVVEAYPHWPYYGYFWTADPVTATRTLHHHRFADGSIRDLGVGARVDVAVDGGLVYRHDLDEAARTATLSLLPSDGSGPIQVLANRRIRPAPVSAESWSGCFGPRFSSTLERGFVSADCDGTGGAVFVWDRATGTQSIGRALVLRISPEVEQLLYLRVREEAEGTPIGELRLHDLVTGADTPIADGVAAESWEDITTDGGDGRLGWGRRIAFLAGCPAGTPPDPCRFDVRVHDFATGTTEVATSDVPRHTRALFWHETVDILVPSATYGGGPFERRLWIAGGGPAVTVLERWSEPPYALPSTDGRFLFALDAMDPAASRGRLVLVDRRERTARTLDEAVSRFQVWRWPTSVGVAWGREDGTLWFASPSAPAPSLVAAGVRLPTATTGPDSIGPITTAEALLYEVVEGPQRGGWAIRWPR